MNNTRPPALAQRLLSRFLRDDLVEEVRGDLEEKFYADLKNNSAFKAKLNYWYQTINYLRPFAIRTSVAHYSNNYGMIKSYFTIASRVIWRNKFHSIINVFGLTLGIAFALLLGVFIYGELQIDQQLSDIDRLYFVEEKYDDTVAGWPAGLLTKEAVTQYPTVFDNYFRFVDRNMTVSKGDKHFRNQGLIGDSSFFKMFGFKILFGDKNTALNQPNSIVITENLARQYFDKIDVVGETLTVATERFGPKEYKVTAVITNPQKKNSVTDFMNQEGNVILPMENLKDFFSDYNTNSWSVNVISYLKLKPGVSRQQASTILNTLFKKNSPSNDVSHRSINLNPLKTYYVTTNNSAVQKLIYSLAFIGVFILILAIVNFINISIAGSFSRLKEVGVRKVVGGLKNQVVIQFLCESILISLISGIIGLLFYELMHTYFGNVLGSQLLSITEFSWLFWLSAIIGILLIGFLAGIYPSIYLSLSKPIESLKGKFRSMKGTIQFSRGLIAVQFTVTLFIFMGSIVISQQFNFFLNKDLGYDKSRILIVQSVPRIYSLEGFERVETAKHEFERLSCVQSVSLSWGAPGWNLSPVGGKIYATGKNLENGIQTDLSSVDEDYLNVFQIKMLDGRFISGGGKNYKQLELVINETAQTALQVKVGDKLNSPIFQGQEFTVIGVMKDFNYESLHEKVKPLAFMHNRDFSVFRYLSFKLQNGNLTESVQQIEKAWKQFFPNDPFSYSFADSRLEALYTTEMQMKKGSSIATALMVLIVLTGVLGLVSLSVSKRRKEIGIRKVLGSSVTDILALISKEYVWLMSLAFSIGTPLAYWFSENWLKSFAFHITLTWWIFAVPFLITFLITLFIVCLHSLKTALANPVNSLRME